MNFEFVFWWYSSKLCRPIKTVLYLENVLLFTLVEVDITAEFFDSSGCIVNLIHTDADRSSVILHDSNYSTCLHPFEFGNHQYVAKVPVYHPHKRQWIVQISGWNLTCNPLHELSVHVALSGNGDKVVKCQELLPFKQTEHGLMLCSYMCPCYSVCSYVLTSI